MNKLIRYALGIVLPPVGVFFSPMVLAQHFFINLALTFLGVLPGSIHAVWAIAKHYEVARLPQESTEINPT